MIVRYVYNEHNGSKQLIGCVCRTDEGRLGYSAVHPKDRRKLSKKLARKIALGRAEKCEVYGYPQDGHWYRMRAGLNGSMVPARIAPHLAALAAVGPKGEAVLGPKVSISADDVKSMSPEDIRRWRDGLGPMA